MCSNEWHNVTVFFLAILHSCYHSLMLRFVFQQVYEKLGGGKLVFASLAPLGYFPTIKALKQDRKLRLLPEWSDIAGKTTRRSTCKIPQRRAERATRI